MTGSLSALDNHDRIIDHNHLADRHDKTWYFTISSRKSDPQRMFDDSSLRSQLKYLSGAF
ncbi:hypothetical protein [Candidatus Methanomassiliicoccus intestinalis]|uniref:hypothetical protein n=1 Tax=Candidatus Methanomassiliicoccus intestinalis TaxID=1406512 RepID=UPI0011C875AC|nr:hypothetical protein [Candidatus Methanomassiliicoccus intestinalis]